MATYRLATLLLLLVCVCSFAVIASSYNARQSFMEWQGLLKKSSAYEVEWGQLLLEKSSLASFARLEDEAAEKLNMVAPDKNHIIVVRLENK